MEKAVTTKAKNMTKEQQVKCHQIIHSHAAVAAATNAGVPIPGVGIVADAVALTTMTVMLAAVFNESLTTTAAKGIAIAALKKTVLKAPIQSLIKILGKFIPYASAAVSISIIEATGWMIANDLAKKAKA